MLHVWKNQLVEFYMENVWKKYLWKSDILSKDAGWWQLKCH